MEAKELRIGNLVYEKGKVKEMYSISNNNAKDYSNMKPIPLTEEWLLKFGFNKISGWDDYKGWIKDDVELECDCYGFDFINYLDKGVDYVHQLQNLYFALTNNELTIK